MPTTGSVASLAQTFTVDPAISPNGIFVAAIDVAFAAVDDQAPIGIELRPTVNGFPDTTKIYHNASTLLSPGVIPVMTGSGANIPNFNTPGSYARFLFPGLVYIPPGQSAIVFNTPSASYEVWIAQLQEQQLGSTNLISGQPYVGSLFVSTNGDVYTPYQNQSLMFRIIRASFTKNTPGIVRFDSVAPSANQYLDVFNVSDNDLLYGSDTSISYSFISTQNNGTVDASTTPLQPGRDIIPDQRRLITNLRNGDFRVFTTIETSDDQVSPVLDSSRLNVITVQNLINNGQLSNSLIQITNAGSGLTPNTLSVVIDPPTGLGGIQANAYAVVVSNTLSQIVFDNPGQGYIITPNIAINGTNTTQPTAVITGETSTSGGNSYVRYITNPVTLAQGFDASALTVYLNGVQISGSEICVYYKIMSPLDPDQNLAHKNWNLMVSTLGTNANNVVSKNINDFLELSFSNPEFANTIPTAATYTSNGVKYNSFNTFQIKICLFSSSTTQVPKVQALRAIASTV